MTMLSDLGASFDSVEREGEPSSNLNRLLIVYG